MKRCFKCGKDKPVEDFYVHPQMADGRLNKCKECAKKDTSDRVRSMPDGGREYEKARNQNPKRRAARSVYHRRNCAKYPERRKARVMVGNAIRDGRLKRLPCEVCGDPKSEAHHPDYSKPLDVRWLCLRHHREAEGRLVA